jgi:hypothetical protein
MKTSTKTEQVINEMKSITDGLTPEEKEAVRDQLIAYLLFSHHTSFTPTGGQNNSHVQGLTEEERELIRKIAEQTEKLHRLMNQDDSGEAENQ